MIKGKHKVFCIIIGKNEYYPVNGLIFKNLLGLHNIDKERPNDATLPKDKKYWSITHIKSGYSIARYKTAKEARQIIKKLLESSIDWSKPKDELPSHHIKEILGIGRQISLPPEKFEKKFSQVFFN